VGTGRWDAEAFRETLVCGVVKVSLRSVAASDRSSEEDARIVELVAVLLS
jgi:hypothetical protein